MTLAEFKTSLELTSPPPGTTTLLIALWHDRKGDWDLAHSVAQDVDSLEGAWIHGYLHRKEGDDSNARYWYRRAGKNFPSSTLDEEWEKLVEEML